jgi:hypothetical protein
MGRTLILLGLMVVVTGILIGAAERVPFLCWLGRLPGDIRIEGAKTRFYFPFTTCILVSVLLTLVVKALRFVIR